MKIIHRPRTGGKTTELIKMADGKKGYIVCHSVIEAMRVFTLAEDLGANINMPITHEEFLDGQYHGKGVQLVYIDNVEKLLERIALGRVTVAAVTFNKSKD